MPDGGALDDRLKSVRLAGDLGLAAPGEEAHAALVDLDAPDVVRLHAQLDGNVIEGLYTRPEDSPATTARPPAPAFQELDQRVGSGVSIGV